MDALRDVLVPFAEVVDRWDWVLLLLLGGWIGLRTLRNLVPQLRLAFARRSELGALKVDEDAVRRQFRLVAARAEEGGSGPIATAYSAMVREGAWIALHDRLVRDDRTRRPDPSLGQRAARTGVEAAMGEIHAALGHGGPDAARRLEAAVDLFEERFFAGPDDLGAAVLAAEAHMEAGWVYRGGGTMDTVSAEGLARMQIHFRRAEDILKPFGVARAGSAMLAEANFRLQGLCNGEPMFHAARAIWAAADPGDPEMMRQVAFHLLPRWYGDYPDIHCAALDIAEKSRDELGEQGYAITILSVATEEPQLVSAIDAVRLVRGAFELIEARNGDARTVNHVCAGLLALTMYAVGTRRKELRDALRQILETRMRAFMLEFWPGTLADIRAMLAPLYGPELTRGAMISIDDHGFRMARAGEA